jgi:4-nitrophenyl phosphatase
MTVISQTIKGLILDMDGVLWRDTEPIGDLPAIFEKINQLGLKVTFATNNATRDEDQYIVKLNSFGIKAVPEQIVNSSLATAITLQKSFPDGGSVFLIGEQGLVNILQRFGYSPSEENPICVVVGMDRSVTYDKMSKAALLIRKGLPFFGTNPDRSFPTPEGQTVGTGAILAAIEAATDVEPIVCGKPFPQMMELALERMKLTPQEVMVVGDRYETDILGGINANCVSSLVLSGVTPESSVASFDPQPDYVFPDLKALIDSLS